MAQVSDVQGRLKQNINFWCEVLQVIDCIHNGYRLPLKFVPPPYSQQNHKSVELHSKFVNEAVQKLITNRCVMKHGTAQVQGNVRTRLRRVLNASCTRLEHVLHASRTRPARISDEAKRAWSLIKFGVQPCRAVLR